MKDNLLQYYSNINYMDRLHRDDDSKISNDSIVFVESEGAIYTHGHRFGGFDSRIISSLFDSAILSMTISPSTTTVGDNKTFTITPSIVGYNFDYSFTITRQILGVDAQPVPLTIPQGATSITDTINVPQNATGIVYTYTVKQSDADGGAQRSYQKTVTIQNTEYIYYGSGADTSSLTVNSSKKALTAGSVANTMTGQFAITVGTAGHRMLFAIPNTYDVQSLIGNGMEFKNTFESVSGATFTSNNVTYQIYQSKSPQNPVTYNLTITISKKQ